MDCHQHTGAWVKLSSLRSELAPHVDKNSASYSRTLASTERALFNDLLTVRLNRLGLRQSLVPSFAESSLPRTMELAHQRVRILRSFSVALVGGFHLRDRVLIWLAPHWEENVDIFHRSTGKDMQNWFEPHQLEHMDAHYFEVLKAKLGSPPHPQQR